MLGVREKERFLEQWRMDATDSRRRMILAPSYSPDFNADEAIWGWAREEATGNLCLGSKAAVQSLPRRRPGRGSANSWPGWPTAKAR